MRIRIWGCRGSLPTPMSSQALERKVAALLAELTPADVANPQAKQAFLARTRHAWTYGGNTSCVEVSSNDTTLVVDAGSGLSAMGQDLVSREGWQKRKLGILLSHFHWDHICGFPFFAPIYRPGVEIEVWSGRPDAEELLAVQMGSAHFPAKWHKLPSKIHGSSLEIGAKATFGDMAIQSMELQHPDGARGWRIEANGKSLCYLTDTEVSLNPTLLAPRYAAFVEGADVVLVDAMYGFLAYHDRINFGHSTIYNWIDFFGASNIGELVIFHHDPGADDFSVDELLASAQRYQELTAPDAKWRLRAAREGMSWEL